MSKQQFQNIKEQLVPDESVVQELYKKLENAPVRRTRISNIQMRRLLPITACLLIVLTGILIYTSLNKSNFQLSQNASDLTDDVKGLPVREYRLSEMEMEVSADRIAFQKLIHFFEHNVENFLIIKVADTVNVSDKKEEVFGDKQISNVKVLQNIYGETVPEVIRIKQYMYGGCTGEEATNLLRVGGVYLLPIVKYEGEYQIIGDLDVLFEIDDTGAVYSHSDFQDFSRYDGKTYTTLTDKIKQMVQNETLMLAASRFGVTMRNFRLAEIAVISDRLEEQDEYGNTEIFYEAHVNQTLSGKKLPDNITVRFYSDEKIVLEKGRGYLLFIDPYEGKYFISGMRSAAIQPDETIKNFESEENVFSPYNGYTVKQIKALADRINEYVKEY